MTSIRTPAHAAAEDIFFGQLVIIWARWFVILAGTILAVWSARTTQELVTTLPFIVILMAVNFFVHGRYLVERPINRTLLLALSALDLLIITAIVSLWGDRLGLANPYFIFYYPILVAFSFVFPPRVSLLYAGVCLLAYSGACLAVDKSILSSSTDMEMLARNLLTMAAVGWLGAYYWRIQRDRRRSLSTSGGSS